jgi:hypothetical protein
MTGTLAGALIENVDGKPLITRIKVHRGIAIEWDGNVEEEG